MALPPRMLRAKREARAKAAKSFINKTVPAALRSSARARQGVENTTHIVDPAKPPSPATPASITLCVSDTLVAAARLAPYGRVAILNMASPLRPGGGVLTGATSQEESLCARTTLYPALREDFYRLPDVGGVYTPDVLVLQIDEDLVAARERFFVDVVTAGMLRMPDVQGDSYAEDKDREMAVRKMRAVMRLARQGGATRLVLGAWGCGAYGNPTAEIARAWKKILTGGKRGVDDAEGWDGLEVVFAIKDGRMARVFAAEFGIDITPASQPTSEDDS